MKNLIFSFVIMSFVLSIFGLSYSAEKVSKPVPTCPNFSSFYCNSLHFTGNGMRYWYEKEDGFMKFTSIPYHELSCKECHVTSCDKCHAVEKDGKKYFSLERSKDTKTCLMCHGREKLTFALDKKDAFEDIHLSAGMGCMDCHSASEVMGDGTFYVSMRQKGAVNADCMNCHKEGGEAPVFNKKIKPHKVHHGKLDCSACHVSASVSCYNCHFGEVVKTGKEKGNFIPMKSWLLLINYEGKVCSGTVMSLVYNGKKFIAYAPFFTHSVMSKGRACSDCHGNSAVKLIKKGEKVPVVKYEDGKIVSWKGVVPCVPDKLEWVFLDKKQDKWVVIKEGKEAVQFTAYGEPLNKKQLRRLMIPFGRKKK